MDVFEAIKTRRSIRKYSDKPVEEEKLTSILEAGRLAPSAMNAQNWRFIVVRDREKIQKLMDASDGQSFVGQAPCVLVVCASNRRLMACGQPTDTVDAAIAMAFMILQAHALGLGTCWLGRFFADAIKKTLNIPDDVAVVAVTPLGYPAEQPAARPRKARREIVGIDTF
ncbi:nitroreductase family protein [Oscillospiraceae bacterium CM]|nr:nitroreductase family protein [Oscillospiraceae bacterium CM]